MAGSDAGRSVALDERAYVPFAVVGIFLLLTSVTIVAVLETRSDPEIDTGPAEAYDRTTAGTQSALQSATTSALQDAAARPIVEPNRTTEIGRAIAGADRNETFTRYVKLLVYVEAQERLAHAGQDLRGDTVTRVDVPDHGDPAAAIDAVTLQVGGETLDYGDPGGGDLPHGAVRVTVPDVQITVERDGAVVAQRTEDYTVTVGTSVFELHHLTGEYERALDTDFGDDAGFANHLASRLSRIAWRRGYAQSGGAPVTEVLSERHVETLGNDALYATQRSVFGEDDPYGERALTRAYACMLARDHHGVYDDPRGGSTSLREVTVDAGTTFCAGPTYAHEPVSGDLAGADAPDWTQLVDDASYLDRPRRTNLSDVAEVGLGELETAGGVEAAIDRIYTVEATVEGDFEQRHATPPTPPESGASVVSIEPVTKHDGTVWVQGQERVVDWTDTGRVRPLYRFGVVSVGSYEVRVEWDTGDVTTDQLTLRYDGNVTVLGEYSPDSDLDELGMEYDYYPGAVGDDDVPYDHNFHEAPEESVVAALEGVETPAIAAIELEQHLRANEESILTPTDVIDVASTPRTARVSIEPYNRTRLRGWVTRDVLSLERDVSRLSRTYDHGELLAEDGPLEELREDLRNEYSRTYEHVDGSTYLSAPDKTRAAVRLAYLDRVQERLNETVDAHDASTSRLNTTIHGHSGRSLSDTVRFTRQQLGSDPFAPAPNRSTHGLLEDVRVVPSASPVYLTFARIRADLEPAVPDAPYGFAPMAGKRATAFSMPHENVSPPGAVRLDTAGRILRAGNATVAVTGPRWRHASDVTALEITLERELDRRIRLAADDAARPFDHVDAADLATAIDREVDRLGAVEERAIRLASDETVTARIAANVSDRFAPPATPVGYDAGNHDPHLEAAIRYGLEEHVGQPAVTDPDVVHWAGRVDAVVRDEVTDADERTAADRLDRAAARSLSDETATDQDRRWLESDPDAGSYTANSLPAGTPVIDRPLWRELTANVWNVHVGGEYARFTVRSSALRSGTDRQTEFVRENETVTVSFDGTESVAGWNRPISFDSRVSVLVGVPADGLGVGDRTNAVDWCSETYDETGAISDPSGFDPCATP